ncbi:heat shock protein 70kD, C-terminal domain-containing protein [Yarrowia lipolytica]|nr:heat shock protein 70kD, C-terminal domain-containing protein [Yarrowia lipolytica]
MRVRPFKFEDYNLNSVTYSWNPVEGEDVSELEVFPEGGYYPNTKVITLHRAAAFDVTARYTNPDTLPEGTNQFICKWTISGMQGKEPAVCKLKLRQDPSGIFTIEDAYVAEEVEVEEPIEGAEPAEEGGEIPTQTVKKWVKKTDLKIEAQGLGLSQKQLQEQIELENSMIMEDKLVADTEDRKNALEEYIYEMRGKLEDIYADFASDAEKANLREKMEKIEDWLYGAGEDAKKALYIAKYEELASIGNLIKGRYNAKQEEERQAKVAKKEAANQAKLAEMMAAKRKEKKDADGDVEVPDVE